MYACYKEVFTDDKISLFDFSFLNKI